MEVGITIALVIGVPLVLLPALFVWYLNIGGIVAALGEARVRKAAQRKAVVAK